MPSKCIRGLLHRCWGLCHSTEQSTKLQLFENPGYGGDEKEFRKSCDDFRASLPNGASSIIVEQDSEPWQVFTKVKYAGDSVCLFPGTYKDLSDIGLQSPVKSFRKAPKQVALKLYETESFGGNEKAFWESCEDLISHFPEGASSIIVNEHSRTWQVFSEAHFQGATVDLNPGGRYNSPEEMGLTDPVKSFRKAPDQGEFLA